MFSIIIPTYNEADQIAQTILKTNRALEMYDAEIIVVDGCSSDNTVDIAQQCGATVIKAGQKGRATQMNIGASVAKYDILYFLHADSLPPIGFTSKILKAINHNVKSGCFRLDFDDDHWFLKANAWFTRFDVNAVRFGDQSLFVTKQVFHKSGGFRECLFLMEDQEIIHRLKKHGNFKVLSDKITTSSRKYIENGIFRTQCIFYCIWAMYYLGFSQNKLLKVHKRLIKSYKLKVVKT